MRFVNYHSRFQKEVQGTLHLPFPICYAVTIVGNGDSSLNIRKRSDPMSRVDPHSFGTVANGGSTRLIAFPRP